MKKKILICSHFFYPSVTPRAFRATALADEFKKKGYQVDLLIGENSQFISDYNSNEKDKSIKDTGSTYKRNNILKESLSKIICYFIGEVYMIKKRKLMSDNVNINNYEEILSIGLPFYMHYLVAKEIRKKNWKGVSIADMGDPFYKADEGKHMWRGMKLTQKTTLDTFSYISIPIDEARMYYEEYVGKEKIKVIPQGFDLNVDYKIEIPLEFKSLKKPVFAYAGEFYEKIRNPERILEFLFSLEKDFTFVIFTNKNGKMYEEILEKYEKKMQGKLIIHDKVPRRTLIKYLEYFDFLLNIENLSENRKPSKLVDFTLSNSPILSVQPVDFNEEVILEFLSGDYRNKLDININEYDIKSVVKQFENLFLEGRH